MDDDQSGYIGIEELETPLIGLGFASTRDEVQHLLDLVDADGSGQIEFDEFLMILHITENNPKTGGINKFFKDLTGSGQASFGSKDLSFFQIVNTIKRTYMLDGLLHGD